MSKGGSNTSSTEIPAWLENAAIENINKGRDVSQIGYVPYYGPDVAAFSPMQQQSMQSTGGAASAFGLAPQGFDATAGIPEAQTFAGGIQGYSSAPMFQQSVDQLQANRPAQYQAMADMFIDPFTGAPAKNNYAPTVEQVMQSNYAQGGNDLAIANGLANSSDGAYYGVNDQYNPYDYNTPTEDISGDGVIDYRDMSFGEAGRRDIGFSENVGNLLKGITGIGSIEKAFDYGQGIADGFSPSPFENGLLSQTSGPSMTQDEAVRQMNEASSRYVPTLPQTGLNERGSTYSNSSNSQSPLSTKGAGYSQSAIRNAQKAQAQNIKEGKYKENLNNSAKVTPLKNTGTKKRTARTAKVGYNFGL